MYKRQPLDEDLDFHLEAGIADLDHPPDQLDDQMCIRDRLNAAPPAVVLMAGLQGAGKTTTAGRRSCIERQVFVGRAHQLFELGAEMCIRDSHTTG